MGMLGTKRRTFGNIVGHAKGVKDLSSLSSWTAEQFDPTLTWDDVEWIKKHWGGKLILKGIMDVEDAQPRRRQRRRCAHRLQPRRPPARRRAVVDHARCRPSPRRSAPRSRSGWTAASAAARTCSRRARSGAHGTLIGRTFLYGLGAMGEAGVTRALEIIHKELDITMAFCGRTQIDQVDSSILLPGTF